MTIDWHGVLSGEFAMPEETTRDSTLNRFASLQTIVCCPHHRTALDLVGMDDLLTLLPEGERERVPADAQGAFVSRSAGLAYPIHLGIVDFLDQSALRVANSPVLPPAALDPAVAQVKRSVKDWYDRFGWQRNADGTYYDTAEFSDDSKIRMTANGLYELLSHLSLVSRLSGGQFLLDAASGAIAHQEYLAYSWFYQRRVCVDMSFAALVEARAKLGDKGFYCLADICQLPFRDNALRCCFRIHDPAYPSERAAEGGRGLVPRSRPRPQHVPHRRGTKLLAARSAHA